MIPSQLRRRHIFLRPFELPTERDEVLHVHGVYLPAVIFAAPFLVRPIPSTVAMVGTVVAPASSSRASFRAQIGRIVLPSYQIFQTLVKFGNLIDLATTTPPASRRSFLFLRGPNAHIAILVLQPALPLSAFPQTDRGAANLLDLVLHVLQPHDRLEQFLLVHGRHDAQSAQFVGGAGLAPEPFGDVDQSVPQEQTHEDQTVRVAQRHEHGEDDGDDVEAFEVDGHGDDGDDSGEHHHANFAHGNAEAVFESLSQGEVSAQEGFARYGEDEPGEEEGGPVGYLPWEVGGIGHLVTVVISFGIDIVPAVVSIRVSVGTSSTGRRVGSSRSIAQIDRQQSHGSRSHAK
mmetsp:Transcript_16700/g.35272  ORF Transcript_16700/g.35272 Transcript_16700/m.35272 type:complete len:346 (+) Transcript_16700:947-1984(+)